MSGPRVPPGCLLGTVLAPRSVRLHNISHVPGNPRLRWWMQEEVLPALLVPAWMETGEGRTRLAHHCCIPINYKKLLMSRLHVPAQRCAGLSDFVEVTAGGRAGSRAAAASTFCSSSPGGEVWLLKSRLASQKWESAHPSWPCLPCLPSARLQDRLCRAEESSKYEAVSASFSPLRK